MTTETQTPPAVVISTDLLCDEWHTHAGGICPLKTGTRYSAKHRDGSITHDRTAHAMDRWQHYGSPCDIVAYKVTHNA